MTLAADLGISDPKILKALEWGLVDATGYQRQVGEAFDIEVTHKEMRQAMTSLSNAARRLEEGKCTDATVKQYQTALAMIPDSYITMLGWYNRPPIYVERVDPTRPDEAALVREKTDAFLSDMVKPGRGGARRQARRYTMGIHNLAKHFTEALPNHRVTARRESLFFKYVAYWMMNCMGESDGVDPSRHIKNAMQVKFKPLDLDFSL